MKVYISEGDYESGEMLVSLHEPTYGEYVELRVSKRRYDQLIKHRNNWKKYLRLSRNASSKLYQLYRTGEKKVSDEEAARIEALLLDRALHPEWHFSTTPMPITTVASGEDAYK